MTLLSFYVELQYPARQFFVNILQGDDDMKKTYLMILIAIIGATLLGWFGESLALLTSRPTYALTFFTVCSIGLFLTSWLWLVARISKQANTLERITAITIIPLGVITSLYAVFVTAMYWG